MDLTLISQLLIQEVVL